MTYRYNGSSDNFDIDHCSYYDSNIEIFKHGMQRRDDRKFTYINNNSSYKTTIESVFDAYNSLMSSFEKISYVHILRSINAKIEIIDQFTNNFSQNALVANENYDVDNFFSVQIRFVCENFNLLTELLSIIPQSASGYFQLSKNYIFLPDEGLDDDENIYTLKISINPACFTTKQQYRKSLNIYLLEIKKAIDSF